MRLQYDLAAATLRKVEHTGVLYESNFKADFIKIPCQWFYSLTTCISGTQIGILNNGRVIMNAAVGMPDPEAGSEVDSILAP